MIAGGMRLRTMLALALASKAYAQAGPSVITIQGTGPRDERVKMVIVGDGYTAAEKAKFQSHLQVVADGVLKAPPLSAYASSLPFTVP